MGFWSNIFGKKVDLPSKSNPNITNVNAGSNNTINNNLPPRDSNSLVNLPAKEMLNKRVKLVEKAFINSGINGQKARVALCLDVSSSMQGMFNNGTIQKVCERLLPLGVKFDDNQAIDIFLFSSSNRCRFIGELTPNNFTSFVDEIIMRERNILWGGTDYAPVMELITDKYTDEAGDPAYVMFLTDGDNSDYSAAERAIKTASRHGIFWQFVGIGNSSFSFLEKLDTMEGRKVDNANFFEINDFSRISDEKLYERMLGEFPDWLKKAKAINII
jgi:hypothetical protein